MQRRTFLLGAGTAAVITACGGSDSTSTPTTVTTTGSGSSSAPGPVTNQPVPIDSLATSFTDPLVLPADGAPPSPEAGQAFLGARFPDGFRGAPSGFVAGTETRAPFVLIDGDGFPMTSGAPDSITVAVQFNGEVIHAEQIPVRAKGEFTPYYPVTFTPPEPGDYALITDVTPVPAWFKVATADTVAVPQIGDKLPGFVTPTVDDLAGVNTLCTYEPSPCPFHTVTLEDALASGPTAFLIATPAFCQTDTCGPSVDYFIELAAEFPDITFVHSEVFAGDVNGGQGTELAPVVAAYQMPWEPAMWVTDATGTIVSALHFAMARADMEAALS